MFLSTFLTIAGHYTVRGFIFVQESILRLHYRSNDLIDKRRMKARRMRTKRNSQRQKEDDMDDGESEPTEVYFSESDDDNGNGGLINSFTYEAP